MSKERARRRAERQREAAVVAAARAAEVERRERRDARVRAVSARLPQRRPRPAGILARRRRRQTWGTVTFLVVVNVLLWAFLRDPAVQAMAVIVSLLGAPVLYTVLFRRT